MLLVHYGLPNITMIPVASRCGTFNVSRTNLKDDGNYAHRGAKGLVHYLGRLSHMSKVTQRIPSDRRLG